MRQHTLTESATRSGQKYDSILQGTGRRIRCFSKVLANLVQRRVEIHGVVID